MALPKRAKWVAGGVVAVAAAGIFLILNRPESSASLQTTDDAYVQADFTQVAPQVSGRVAKVYVEDNQPVKAGDLLAELDNRDQQVALQAAQASVAHAEAAIASLQAHLSRQQAAIHQASAVIDADEAALNLARANHKRYRNLAADGSGTLQALQQAEAELRIQNATREKDVAALDAATRQVDILQADLKQARAALAQARAARAAAELDLSYTRLTAPISGVVGQRRLYVGNYVNKGAAVLTLVPLQAVYIEANYRETQLARVHPGQAVRITVDALPGVTLKGHVESLGPASGVSYSAVAPHNATGNFTKIVQRLPVRIRIDPDQEAARQLRVGMSVQPEIDTRDNAV